MTPDDILNDDYTYFDTLELTTAPCIIDCHAKIGLFWACLFQVFNGITEPWNQD